MLVKPVDLVQERRHLLYLVDDDLTNGRAHGELATEHLRILQIPAILVRFEQIDPHGVGIGGVQQRGLSGLAGPPQKEGLGACTGDSGAPVFANGAIIGVVSWSTGPRNAAGCGGLTGVTPLALYRSWITDSAKLLGNQL
jgi:hypothetical protein